MREQEYNNFIKPLRFNHLMKSLSTVKSSLEKISSQLASLAMSHALVETVSMRLI